MVTHVAAMNDRLEILKHLLHKHEERFPHQDFSQEEKDNKGMVPIHYAVLRKNYEMVKYLLEHKADEFSVGKYKKDVLSRNDNKK